MKEIQRIKRLIIPLLKGMPVIIITLIIALFIARKAIQYTVPKYQSMAKIKLDDRKYGMSANNLYEDFDVFATENKIETEAEILKSPLLIGKAIDALKLDVMIKRQGRLKHAFLYKDNPFIFEYDRFENNLEDQKYVLRVNGKNFVVETEEQQFIASSSFGQPFTIGADELIINLNEALLEEKDIATNGEYLFEIKSRNSWISYMNELVDVKAIDKEIAVLRVVVKSEDPEFSADFANILCSVYVDDYIYTKSLAASKTLSFIDERMTALQSVLSESENKLEGYKIDHDVVNTRQETETGLRELSKLQVQLINLEMEEKAVGELEAYISAGDYYEETAINFGFGDLLLTELVKKLKLYTDEKRDLQIKYTDNDPKVKNAQEKIDDIEAYIKEAIAQNKVNIELRRTEIQNNINRLNTQFEDIPTREKEMRILERDFQINESVYTFLAQKKLEAQIASSALMSFHRVIQPAVPAKEPVSPNRVLITFVCGFLGVFTGVLLVFGGKFIRGKIVSKSDIEKLTATPVAGVITGSRRKKDYQNDFTTLATGLQLKHTTNLQTVVITSSTRQEGKSFVTENLADTYSQMGYSVAILDLNHFNPAYGGEHDFTISELVKESNAQFDQFQAGSDHIAKIGFAAENANPALLLSHKNFGKAIDRIRQKFDLLLIDTPGSVISIEALTLLKYADICLYIIRAKKSNAEYVSNVDIIKNDCNFDQVEIVLNGAHSSTNYSGNFSGSQLHYSNVPKGIFKKIKYYLKAYTA